MNNHKKHIVVFALGLALLGSVMTNITAMESEYTQGGAQSVINIESNRNEIEPSFQSLLEKMNKWLSNVDDGYFSRNLVIPVNWAYFGKPRPRTQKQWKDLFNTLRSSLRSKFEELKGTSNAVPVQGQTEIWDAINKFERKIKEYAS